MSLRAFIQARVRGWVIKYPDPKAWSPDVVCAECEQGTTCRSEPRKWTGAQCMANIKQRQFRKESAAIHLGMELIDARAKGEKS